MSEFVEVKTTELVGPALDWAVAKSQEFECGFISRERGIIGCNAGDGRQYVIGGIKHETVSETLHTKYYQPSTNWAQGGPLIDECDVWLSDDEGACVASCPPHAGRFVVEGGTNLIAACRAIVAAKLGDVVPVPKELISD